MPISRRQPSEATGRRLRTGFAGIALARRVALAPWITPLVLLSVLASVPACQRCSRKLPLAQLDEKQGRVARDLASTPNEWFEADVGAHFQLGEAIFTKKGATAHLTLEDGSKLGLQEETLIRFLDHEPGSSSQRVDLEMGNAYIEAGSSETVLSTSFGEARVEAGARLQLSRSQNAIRFEVLVGRASIENSTGKSISVAQGQAVEISLGSAVLELAPEAAPPPDEESGTDTAEVTGSITADVRGNSVRVRAADAVELEPMPAGSSAILAGSTLEVGPGSTVRVRRGDDWAELEAGGTYLIGAQGGLVEAKQGGFRIASEGTMRIAVPGGVIEARAGSARIDSLGREGTRVTATQGEVGLHGTTTELLTPGERGTLSPDGEVQVEGRGPTRVDVVIDAGQTVTIHDPRPPTAVRVRFAGQCERGTLRFTGSASARPEAEARGTDSASFVLGKGTTGYGLHCVDASGKEGPAVATGKLTVLMDAGTKPMPKSAPSTSVEVDGRPYTVLYQNSLPRVTLRWSKAPPETTAFKIHVRSGNHQRVLSASRPTYTFPPGALGDGQHTVYFEGGGRVSRQTSVTIVFDNAAATVSLSTPERIPAGEPITLAGTALPGWTVAVDGKPVPQDAEGRFSASSVMPEKGQPATVVLTHPSRGTHIYLRRPAGEP